MTDIYPKSNWVNPIESNCNIQYYEQPVNAQAVPQELNGIRTIFEGFHHFKPQEAVAILKDAVTQKQPIAIFEFQTRSILDTLFSPLPLAVPAAVLLSFWHTPFSQWKLFWTLVVFTPFILIFDGIVSILRTYTTEELAELAEQAGTEGFRWEVRETRDRGFGRITCLIGWPDQDDGVYQICYPPKEIEP